MENEIYDIPDSVEEMFEKVKDGEIISYSIIDYSISDMDNVESLGYFLELIEINDDDIVEDLGTQVILKNINYNFQIAINSGGLGDFYSHGFDVEKYEE